MKDKPRKTATFIMDTKEKSIIEAQKYEIDKKQIYDFYGIKPKKERIYNVIKKQIAFGKDSAFKNIDKNKKYSNYCAFREYFQKAYDIEDIKADIEEVKLLVNFSENTRDEFYRFFHFDRADYINNGEGQTPTQIGIGMKGDAIYSPKNSDESRKRPINDKILSVNDFIRKCKMMRRKREEDENTDKTKMFKMYSDLNIPSNKFAAMDNFYSNKNKLNNKYYLEKESLIKCFNREERFIHFNHLIKESYIKEAPDSLNPKTKDKYSSYYFDLMFDKREESYYEQIDHFFSKYNITSFKLKDEEADFYGKIYGILCKNNYMKFLSYLYSKNDLFKFIYDEFSDKDATISNFSLGHSLSSQYKLEGKNQNLLASSDSFTDNKIRQKELGIKLESKKNIINVNMDSENIDEEKPYENPKTSEIMQQIPNSYLFIKVGFLNKLITEKNILEFFKDDKNNEKDNDEENSSEEDQLSDKNSSKNEKIFSKYLKECSKKPLDDIFLINSSKNLKILDNNYNNILDQKMSKIIIVKINRDIIKKYILSLSLQIEYYIIEIKNDSKKDYYLFKISFKNINLFETQIKENFYLEKIKNFINNFKKSKSKKIKTKKKDKKEKKEKEPKKINKDSENEKSEKSEKESFKNKEKEKDDKKSEESKEESKKSESGKQSPKASPFNQIESYSSENKVSIVNESSEDFSPGKIEKVMKNSNIKNISKYQSEHKSYEFMIDNEKYTFDIFKGELRCKAYNKQMTKYSLSEISPQKVVEEKEDNLYRLVIKKGKKIIYNILNQDKANLENFYSDLVEAKQLYGY